jgi:hypothetical protein
MSKRCSGAVRFNAILLPITGNKCRFTHASTIAKIHAIPPAKRSLARALVLIIGPRAKGKTMNHSIDASTSLNPASTMKRNLLSLVAALPIVILVKAVRANRGASKPGSRATSAFRTSATN